jgi:hypothetical protein
MLIAIGMIAHNLKRFECGDKKQRQSLNATWFGIVGVQSGIVAPLLVSAWVGSTSLYYFIKSVGRERVLRPEAGLAVNFSRDFLQRFGLLDPLLSGCILA